jgi:dTMP kinase
MAQGCFITFEGLDGSGKTTQLRRLATALEAQGRVVVTLRQPGGTALGDRIRSLLVDSRTEAETGGIAPMAELALMFADRAQAIRQTIAPALEAGAVVLCDRYTDSSEAYQGGGRQLGAETIRDLHRIVCDDLQPDLTLLLLPPLNVSLARARRRNQRSLQQTGQDENRFEREPDSFYERVHAAYRALAVRDRHRVTVFSDDLTVDAIQTQIEHVVLERLNGV